MSKKRATRAAAFLEANGFAFDLVPYEISDAADESLGEAAARALGAAPDDVFKTLIAEVDGKPTCAVVPVNGSLSLKALAAAAGGKRAQMAPPAAAERLTGYVTGGISPLGQTRQLRTFIDGSAEGKDVLYVSAGKRGLQLRLSALALVAATGGMLTEGLASYD